MPEQLKPCPACQEPSAHGGIHENYSNGSVEHFIECWSCDMQGPHCYTEAAAIASWNRLPRTPTWTTEPPKVPGWYWWRWAKYQGWMCLAVRDGLIVEHPRKVLRHAQDIGGQWAGPIPEPLEPEES